MSLINDALKRASNPSGPPQGENPLASLQPIEYQPAGRFSRLFPAVLCTIGVGTLLVAGGLWLKSNGTPSDEAQGVVPPPKKVATPAPAEVAANPGAALPAAFNRAADTLRQVESRQREGEEVAAHFAVPAASAPVPNRVEPPPVVAPPPAEPAERGPAEAIPAVFSALPKPAEIAAADRIKLQAIYYRLKGPTVVINGQTLGVGEAASGVKVIAIHRTSTEIETQGLRKTLTLQ